MFQLSLFVECQNENEALKILHELLQKIDTIIISHDVSSNEPYWKCDGWFTIVCNIETSISIIDIEKAEKILEKVSNKWLWNKGKISASSTINNEGTVFFNDKVRFFTCWFEDLE
ncbi:hypothetical protein [Bacillus sp. 71mf]|nr:hypothetical protein [Bacillus sp. 71mf]SFK04052.1 hypothetical protein SAMN04488574_14611 [Bacillus sp. 71mf]SFT20242.1 hypothetical protein SAMN04488145_12015 [Bacillus sp. 103mf]